MLRGQTRSCITFSTHYLIQPRRQVRRDGGQTVGAELFLQCLGLVTHRTGRAIPLAGGYLAEVAIQRLFQQQLFRAGPVDLAQLDPAHHFILGAARPVLGITIGAERLDDRRPSALADDRLPGVRGCFGDGCHNVFRTGVTSDTGIKCRKLLSR